MIKRITLTIIMCFMLVSCGCSSILTKSGTGNECKYYAIFQTKNPNETNLAKKMKADKAVMEYNLSSMGLSSARVVCKGNRLRVELPDVENPDKIFSSVGSVVKLAIHDPDGTIVLYGYDIEKAAAERKGGDYIVKMKLSKDTSESFAQLLEKVNGQIISITLNDVNISNPSIVYADHNDWFIIEGNYNHDDAEQLAMQLDSFSLPAEIEMIESGKVG